MNVQEQIKKYISNQPEAFPSCKINFDLSDCDKMLRVEGDNMEPLQIIILIKEFGFACELLA